MTSSRRIFWWEWAHRMLARGVGVVFALPLAFFWVDRPPRARPEAEAGRAPGARRAAGRDRLVDGGVRPGRARLRQPVPAGDAPDACLPDLRRHDAGSRAGWRRTRSRRPTGRSQRFAGILVLLVLVQIYLGGLVAGLRCRAELQHLAADGRRRRARRSAGHRAGLAQLLREPEDGAVRASDGRLYACFAAGALAHDRDAPAPAGDDACAPRLVLFALVLVQASIGIGTLADAGAACTGRCCIRPSRWSC